MSLTPLCTKLVVHSVAFIPSSLMFWFSFTISNLRSRIAFHLLSLPFGLPIVFSHLLELLNCVVNFLVFLLFHLFLLSSGFFVLDPQSHLWNHFYWQKHHFALYIFVCQQSLQQLTTSPSPARQVYVGLPKLSFPLHMDKQLNYDLQQKKNTIVKQLTKFLKVV